MIQVGSKVQYSEEWLQSTSTYTGNIPRAKGIVKEINNLGDWKIATIDWDLEDVPLKVNVTNLKELK